MEGRHSGTHKEIEAKKAAKKAAKAAKAEAAAPALVVEKAARKREPETEAPPSDAATAKAAKRAKKAAKAAAKAEAPVVAQAAAASEDDQPMKIHKKEAPPESAPEDIRLACIDCSQEFLFTVGEQEFFKQKVPLNLPLTVLKPQPLALTPTLPLTEQGFNYAKTRCRACADAKKARFGEGKGGQGGGMGGGKGSGAGGSSAGPKCYNCGGVGARGHLPLAPTLTLTLILAVTLSRHGAHVARVHAAAEGDGVLHLRRGRARGPQPQPQR